jgi:hypothetical protein
VYPGGNGADQSVAGAGVDHLFLMAATRRITAPTNPTRKPAPQNRSHGAAWANSVPRVGPTITVLGTT